MLNMHKFSMELQVSSSTYMYSPALTQLECVQHVECREVL